MNDLKNWLKENNISEVESLIHDMSGNARGKFIPVEKYMTEQLRMPESVLLQSVTGDYCDEHEEFVGPTDQDMVIEIEQSTARIVPWASKPTAQIIHDCQEFNGNSHKFSSRNVLKRVLDAYERAGLKAIIAPEIECYLIDKNDNPQQEIMSPVGQSGRRETVRKSYSIDALYEFEQFIDTLNKYCKIQNLNIDSLIHEEGNAQLEINFLHGDPLDLADQVFTIKRTLRHAAIKNNMYVTFMAKPMANEPGSSMHIHQSILDSETGNNIFINEDGTKSDAFFGYIAGLQKYTPELFSIYAPNVNSYRRFSKDSSAPTNMHWGYDNRTTGIRIPDSNAANTRIENRFSGIDTNPYLSIAVSLACGLAGIQDNLKPTEPFEGNAGEEPRIVSRTLVDALQKLDNLDRISDILGADFIRAFRCVKQSEFNDFSRVITSWEREHLMLSV